jgi:erythronate-4-phosphate dehydrogenase
MLIVADENIPLVTQAFDHLGEVRSLPGRKLRQADLRGADILLVRSVTRVDRELLDNTPVRFVASATIGKDHLDTDWLDNAGIGWATAPGCNARAVAEWVIAALLVVCERLGRNPTELRAGIVGCGNVGTQVRLLLGALGLDCVVNDPPLAEAGVADNFVSLDDVLDCDFVTLHTPLTLSGPHATRHLIGADQLARLRRGSLLFNSGRGDVVDSKALLENLRAARLHCALDVWENEPNIDPELLALCELGTPHVAGYSYDGRVRGTQMIYQSVCKHLGIQPSWKGVDSLAPPEDAELDLAASDNPIRDAVLHACDIRRDDAELRALAGLTLETRAPWFDSLRKHYPRRREFNCFRVFGASAGTRSGLEKLGFSLDE